MKRFAGYVLEGLLVRGQDQVWLDLGLFASLEELTAGRDGLATSRPGIAQTRVTAFYLDSGVAEPTRVRPARVAATVEAVPTLTA